MEKKVPISLNLTDADREVVDRIATQNRRCRTDMLRIIIEDLVDGRITIDDVPDEEIVRTSAGVRVTSTLKDRFDAFRKQHGGLSADKIMVKALKKMSAEMPS